MIKLGTDTFIVPAPSGMRSFALQQRIIPIAGSIATIFAQLLGGVVAAGNFNLGDLLKADVVRVLPQAMPFIGRVFSDMPDGELERLTREMLRDATWSRGGMKALPLFGSSGGDSFDTVMQGRSTEIWQLLWYALEVWYPDFFALGAAFRASAKVKPSATSDTSEPNTPAGA